MSIGGPGSVAGIGGGLNAAGRMRSLREMEPQRGLTLETQPDAKADFGKTFSEVLGEVNELQLKADEMVERFAAGQVQDLHDVVIAQQEAAIAFHLVQEVRDKLLQGYQEIMRMQV